VSIYDDALKAFRDAVNEFGVYVSITRRDGAFDPVAGSKSSATTTEGAQILLKNSTSTSKSQSAAVQGKQIEIGDKTILSESELIKGDIFSLAGKTWTVYGTDSTLVEGKVLNFIGYIRENG